MALKDQVKRMIGRRGRLLVRRLRTQRLPAAKAYQNAVRGMRTLEIGGPSDILGFGGILPIYSSLGEAHNCNFADKTIWSSEAIQYSKTFFSEGSALPVDAASYDCVIASHCLEHMADPIKGLLEWKRVLRSGGLLLLVLPHRDHTFDWKRPVTTLEHMRQDFQSKMPESDATHLDEVLQLHDLSRDPGAGTPEQFRQRCLKNAELRAIHHHVFLPDTASELLRDVGFTILRQDVHGMNIFTLASNT